MDSNKFKKKETITTEDPETLIKVVEGQNNTRVKTEEKHPDCKIEIDVLEKHNPNCTAGTHLDELRRPITRETTHDGYTVIDRIGITIPCHEQQPTNDPTPSQSQTRTSNPASKFSLLDTQVELRGSRKGTHLNQPDAFNAPARETPSSIDNVPLLRKLGCSSPSFVARMHQKCGHLFQFGVQPMVTQLVYNAGTGSTSNPFDSRQQVEPPAGSSRPTTTPSGANQESQQKITKKNTEVTFNNNPSVFHLDPNSRNFNNTQIANRNMNEKHADHPSSNFKGQTLKDFIDPCWQKTGYSFYNIPNTTMAAQLPPSRLPSNTDEAVAMRSLDTEPPRTRERTKEERRHRERSSERPVEQPIERPVEEPIERKLERSSQQPSEQRVERRTVELVDPTALQNILTPQNLEVLQNLSQLTSPVNQPRKAPAVDTSTMTSFTTCCPRPMYRGSYEEKASPVIKPREQLQVFAAPSVHKTVLPSANIYEPILKQTAQVRDPARRKSSHHDIEVLGEVKDNFADVSSDEDDGKSLAAETEAGTDAYSMNEDDEYPEEIPSQPKKMGFFRKVFLCGCMRKNPGAATAEQEVSGSQRYYDGQSRVSTVGSVRTGSTAVPRRDSSFVTTTTAGRPMSGGSRTGSANSRPLRGHLHNKTASQAWSRKRPNAHPSRRNLTPSVATRYS